jgi:hypothetical protein
MGYVLIEKCDCGGDIGVVRYRGEDPITFKKEDVVSHASCMDCFKNVILPNENWGPFVRENCRFIRHI